MYYCCGISDVGNSRDHNEDAFLINKIVLNHAGMESDVSHPFIVGVADGVAGENSGEVASRLCLEMLGNIHMSSQVDLRRKVMVIHEQLRHYGQSHASAFNMQTTLCAFAADELGQCFAVNVGDSRMYRLNRHGLRQVTEDQSWVQFLYDNGRISDAERSTHAQKHVIFPVLGNLSSTPTIDVIPMGACHEDDLFLMCTDGISDHLSEQEMTEILTRKEILSRRLSVLVRQAIKNGSRDNLTALAVVSAPREEV